MKNSKVFFVRLPSYSIKETNMDNEEKTCALEPADEEEILGFETALNEVYAAWREFRSHGDSRMAEKRFTKAFSMLEQSKYQEKRIVWAEVEARERRERG